MTTISPTDLAPAPEVATGSLEPVLAPPGTNRVKLAALRSVASSIAWALVGLGVLVAAWAIVATRVKDLPTPAETFSELRTLLSDPFYDNGPNDKGLGLQLLSSLQRVGVGFAIAAMVGIPVGLLMGTSRRTWKAANPVIQLLRPVSPLAWFPIWLVILKDAPNAAIWVIFITALWPIVINTAAGAASVPADQRNVARVFQFNRRQYVRHVLVPHSLPSIVTGLRLSMGVAWMVIVAVEMLSGGVGVGFFVWDSYNALNLSKVIAAIILIGAVGVVLDVLFLRLARSVAIEEVDT